MGTGQDVHYGVGVRAMGVNAERGRCCELIRPSCVRVFLRHVIRATCWHYAHHVYVNVNPQIDCNRKIINGLWRACK